MNVEKPKKEKLSKKAIIIYMSAIIICIVAGIIIYFVQRFGDGKSSLIPFVDPTIPKNDVNEQTNLLKENFDNMFTNELKTRK